MLYKRICGGDYYDLDGQVLYRGMSEKFVQALKDGAYFGTNPNNSIGTGIYVAPDRRQAESYASGEPDGVVVTIRLKNGARVIDINKAVAIVEDYIDQHPRDKKQFLDRNTQAATFTRILRQYKIDAVVNSNSSDQDMNIINPNAITSVRRYRIRRKS